MADTHSTVSPDPTATRFNSFAPLHLCAFALKVFCIVPVECSLFPPKRIAVRRRKIHHGRVQEIWQTQNIIAHTQTLARSLKYFTGRDLLTAVGVQSRDLRDCSGGTLKRELQHAAEQIFHAPFILVSHGTEADPILNYGNAAALALWEMSWAELTSTPSRLTAEAPNREERARLLATVTARGFIDDYSGIRISKSGRRFKISRATVWNLISENGQPCGQAAMFDRWEFL